MNKNHKLCILLSFLFITCSISTSAYSEEKAFFEKGLYEIGYTSVGEASVQCSKLFKRTINMPTGLPPMVFTHQFARCNNLEGHWNDEFEVEYVNEETGLKHYIVRIRPVQSKVTVRKTLVKEVYTLRDQTKALLFSVNPQSSLATLAFEKNGWQYMLILDERGLKDDAGKVLVQIANTLKR